MRVFTTKSFRRFQRKEGIGDAALCEAVRRAERGLVDADLRHGLIKQRVARPGEGRHDGFRTVIAHRVGEGAVFVFKRDQANLSKTDERDLKDFGALLLALDARGIETMLTGHELTEVDHGEEA